MKTFQDFTSQDYENMSQEILTLSQKNEQELFETLGYSVYDEGIRVSNKPEVVFDVYSKPNETYGVTTAYDYVRNRTVISTEEAENKGKSFWTKFSEKIKKVICENEQIVSIINGGDLRDKLAAAIPAILVAIGTSFILAPIYVTIISIAFALILKSGFQAYCEAQ